VAVIDTDMKNFQEWLTKNHPDFLDESILGKAFQNMKQRARSAMSSTSEYHLLMKKQAMLQWAKNGMKGEPPFGPDDPDYYALMKMVKNYQNPKTYPYDQTPEELRAGLGLGY